MTCKFLVTVIGLAFSVVPAFAQAAIQNSPNYVLCRNQKNVRTIHVEKVDEEKQCVTKYTKAGIDHEVGRAQHIQSCVKVMDNIKANLEKAQWKCKEVGNVSVTSAHDSE